MEGSKWAEPGNKEALIALQEFPGYYLDLERCEVWSFVHRWNWHGKAWRRLTISQNGVVALMQNGKQRYLRIGKLIASVKYNVSYDELPHLFSFGADGVAPKLRVLSAFPAGTAIDSDTLNQRIQDMRRERNHAVRVERTKRAIEGLQLLLKAFEGDAGPLIEFVASGYERYCRMMRARAYYTKEDLQDAYDNAFNLLTRQLERSSTRFYDIDNWMVSKMRLYLSRRPKKVNWNEFLRKAVNE